MSLLKFKLYYLLIISLIFSYGIVVYIADRGGNVFFLHNWLNLELRTHSVFGQIHNNLPSFAHSFFFSSLTFLLLYPETRLNKICILVWLIIEIVFEIGQHKEVAENIAKFLNKYFKFSNESTIINYFQSGTYDINDILAIVAGCLLTVILYKTFNLVVKSYIIQT